MIDRIDMMLETWRDHDAPHQLTDDDFVTRVMAELASAEVTTDVARIDRRRRLRRPMVASIAAAIVVTGGAVAAVVGTNPASRETTTPVNEPKVSITATQPSVGAPKARSDAPGTVVAAPNTLTPTGKGYPTDHTSFIVDKATGLLLQTESYTTAFTVGQAHRVTLTLENTGRDPIAFNAPEGCALQVMAYTGNEADTAIVTDTSNGFEWACAGSDADPRIQTFGDTFVLAPGERKVADAFVTLPATGSWTISGMCRCDFRQVKPTPVPKSDPLSELTQRTVPSFVLGEEVDGRNLIAPPIGIRATR